MRAGITSCASNPDNIEGKYISPVIYQNWTCDQLTEERTRLTLEVARVTGLQRENAHADAAMMAVGLVLLWPVLFGLAATKDRKDEVARLKGEFEAVDQAVRVKQCPMPPLPPSSPPKSGSEAASSPQAGIVGKRSNEIVAGSKLGVFTVSEVPGAEGCLYSLAWPDGRPTRFRTGAYPYLLSGRSKEGCVMPDDGYVFARWQESSSGTKFVSTSGSTCVADPNGHSFEGSPIFCSQGSMSIVPRGTKVGAGE